MVARRNFEKKKVEGKNMDTKSSAAFIAGGVEASQYILSQSNQCKSTTETKTLKFDETNQSGLPGKAQWHDHKAGTEQKPVFGQREGLVLKVARWAHLASYCECWILITYTQRVIPAEEENYLSDWIEMTVVKNNLALV